MRTRTRCALALVALLVSALAAHAASAATPLTVGANDDAAKDPADMPWFFPTMASNGLKDVAITLRWDETAPTTIDDKAELGWAMQRARENGIAVQLVLYPLRSMAFTGGTRCVPSTDPESCGNAERIQQFAQWTARVARSFPNVRQFVVMNECNQPLFVNPQWDTAGANTSAQVCGRALVAAYDALKAVSTSNFVWGVGLSPRGNDNPNAASNSSTRPVTFLRALGAWFRSYVAKTKRTAPLMDGFDYHPYPIPQSQPFAQGYTNPNEAGVSNLPRIYQAFYDAFAGTPQPTIGQQAGGWLPVSLNETGVQTDSSGRAGYVGTEVSATSAGGVIGQFATEDYQASWYRQMLDLLVCDPNVRLINIFHLIDEPSLPGWQSGLYYLDRTAKLSAQTVRDWLAQTGGRCPGAVVNWTPPGMAAVPQPLPTTTTTTAPPAPRPTCTGSRCKPATAACFGSKATNAGCSTLVKSLTKELVSLQRRVVPAQGKTKAALKTEIAAVKQAIAYAKAGLATLTR